MAMVLPEREEVDRALCPTRGTERHGISRTNAGHQTLTQGFAGGGGVDCFTGAAGRPAWEGLEPLSGPVTSTDHFGSPSVPVRRSSRMLVSGFITRPTAAASRLPGWS